MSRLRLRKVKYVTNYDYENNNIKNPVRFHTGYIVTGFLGSGDYYIPIMYKGTRIIGVAWQAYTTLPEYKTGSSSYTKYACYPRLYIHENSLLFVMLPPRNSETIRIFPRYFVDDINGRFSYSICGMSYNRNRNLMQHLLEGTGAVYNAGYTGADNIKIEKWEGSRKHVAEVAAGMYSSDTSLNEAKMGLHYFEYPYFEWHEIRDALKNSYLVLAHCRVDKNVSTKKLENVAFAYTILNGYDEEIDSSTSDIYGTRYYLQNQ